MTLETPDLADGLGWLPHFLLGADLGLWFGDDRGRWRFAQRRAASRLTDRHGLDVPAIDHDRRRHQRQRDPRDTDRHRPQPHPGLAAPADSRPRFRSEAARLEPDPRWMSSSAMRQASRSAQERRRSTGSDPPGPWPASARRVASTIGGTSAPEVAEQGDGLLAMGQQAGHARRGRSREDSRSAGNRTCNPGYRCRSGDRRHSR